MMKFHVLRKPVDMDLCCLIDAGERLAASDLVAMVGDLLERGISSPTFFESLLTRRD